MKICNNDLTELDIDNLKNYWNNNESRIRAGWVQDGKVLDRKLEIKKSDAEFSIVENIVKKYFTEYDDIWCAFQRQHFVQPIHIDDYSAGDGDKYRYTFIFSVLTEPRAKTIVWKDSALDVEKFNECVARWGRQRKILKKKSNLSTTEEIEHTFDPNQEDYLSDYLELDGIYENQKGSGVLFYSNRFHCSSNWIKHSDIPYMESLEIHVVSKQKLEI